MGEIFRKVAAITPVLLRGEGGEAGAAALPPPAEGECDADHDADADADAAAAVPPVAPSM
jgi:hypothetical protein